MGFELRDSKAVMASKKVTVDSVSGRSNKLDAINFDKDHLTDAMKQELKKLAGV